MPVQPGQVNRPKADTYTIPELLSYGLSGAIRIPRFQRNFVWDAEDVRQLFDSVWRGFPVGTLLLWKHEAEQSETSFGSLTIKAPRRTDALWVVDGQQRIASFIGVLNREYRGVDERFEVYFDLRRGRFVSSGKNQTPPTWLPLYVAVETRSVLSWLRDHDDDLDPDDYDTADALSGAIRDYQVPAYIVESDDDAMLRAIFDRVNSAGKPIGRAEIFHALFASDTEPGSPATVVVGLRRHGFGDVDADRVVQSLLAIRGGNVQRDVHDEFSPGEAPTEWYEHTEIALSRTIGYLRGIGVPHILLMPSTFPLPVLAAFFHLHPEPEPWTLRLLGRWLWRGWTHGFGRSGQTPALRQAIHTVNPKKGVPSSAPTENSAVRQLLKGVSDDPPPKAVPDILRTESAAGKLSLLAMAAQRPLEISGEPIDIAATLNTFGMSAVTEFVRNNRARLGARGFWPHHAPRPTGREPKEVLLSHAIDDQATRLLMDRDTARFVDHRTAYLQARVREFLAARIESGRQERRSIAELIVPEVDEVGDA